MRLGKATAVRLCFDVLRLRRIGEFAVGLRILIRCNCCVFGASGADRPRVSSMTFGTNHDLSVNVSLYQLADCPVYLYASRLTGQASHRRRLSQCYCCSYAVCTRLVAHVQMCGFRVFHDDLSHIPTWMSSVLLSWNACLAKNRVGVSNRSRACLWSLYASSDGHPRSMTNWTRFRSVSSMTIFSCVCHLNRSHRPFYGLTSSSSFDRTRCYYSHRASWMTFSNGALNLIRCSQIRCIASWSSSCVIDRPIRCPIGSISKTFSILRRGWGHGCHVSETFRPVGQETWTDHENGVHPLSKTSSNFSSMANCKFSRCT